MKADEALGHAKKQKIEANRVAIDELMNQADAIARQYLEDHRAGIDALLSIQAGQGGMDETERIKYVGRVMMAVSVQLLSLSDSEKSDQFLQKVLSKVEPATWADSSATPFGKKLASQLVLDIREILDVGAAERKSD